MTKKKIVEKNTDFTIPFVNLVEENNKKNIETVFMSVDPGIRNIGWCIFSFNDCQLIDAGVISHDKTEDRFLNDERVTKINKSLEQIILKYKPNFSIVEKLTFSKGRYSFSESILLKAVGIIHLTILNESIPILEIVNIRAQSLILEKADNRKSNKEEMKKYVMDNIPEHFKKNKTLSKKIYDTSDAIFIAMAFRSACEIHKNKN